MWGCEVGFVCLSWYYFFLFDVVFLYAGFICYIWAGVVDLGGGLCRLRL